MRRLGIVSMGAGVALVGCGCTGGAFRATRDFALTKPWENYERIVVRSRNGRVDLAVGDGNDVRIDGKMYIQGITLQDAESNLDELAVVAEADSESAGTFRVEFQVPESLWNKSPGASFRIRVPKACAATVDTSNGGIRAAGLKGVVALDTSNGEITVEDIDGRVEADTSNGRITARNVTGDLVAVTSNGDAKLDGATGTCRVRTSNGRVELSGARGNVEAITSNGDIRVDATPATTGNVVLTTSNGSIWATLPAQMTADVRLRTSNGGVDASFGEIPLKVRQFSRRSVDVSMNGGGAGKIVAETSNGPITLRFR